jgi:hypothetical protein
VRNRKRPQRCTANAADGSRCGKWCAEGKVVCAKHDPEAKAAGIIAAQESDDPLVALKRLMKNSDPAIRLRATNSYLDRLEKVEKGCPRCASEAAKEGANRQLVDYATPAQRAELRSLILAIHTITAAVREYIASGGLPPTESEGQQQEQSHASVLEQHQPPRPATEIPESPGQRTHAEADQDDEVVMVWRDGALHAEPRSMRKWKAVRS